MKSEYELHFSVSGYSVLVLDMIFNNTDSYGAVEYVVLFEKGTVRAYLSSKGMRQAHKKGEILSDDAFFSSLVSDSKMLRKKLRSYTPNTKITTGNALEKWKRTKKLNDEFNRIYHYYEQPFQMALEERVLRHISQEELLSAMSNVSVFENIQNAESKKYLKRLMIMGEMKLGMHKDAEKFVSGNGISEFIAKKYVVPVHLVDALRMEELEDVLTKKEFSISREELEERNRSSVFVKKNGVWKLFTGKKYLHWKHKVQGMPARRKVVSGGIAFPGVARGKVVVHLSWTGTTDMKKGDVLVCGMTNPQMIPFIKKASAIVTDEGGITCHAAIIAREMKKPCIVGTKIATQVFRNGDKVFVDANKGTARLLVKK
jgi:phosphohistidine swiveling domain-containing protein